MAQGIPLVFLDRWDSEGVLQTIETPPGDPRPPGADHVPAPAGAAGRGEGEVRPLQSLRYIIHGAAPCPPEVKKAMIDWLGPIINEYYAGSEGGAGFLVISEEWLTKPGTVGKLPDPDALKILDDEGDEVDSAGEPGTLYFQRLADRPVRVLQGPGQDRRGAPRTTTSPWATSAISTRTTTSSSPAARPSASSPAGSTSIPRRSTTRSSSTRRWRTAAPSACPTRSGARR